MQGTIAVSDDMPTLPSAEHLIPLVRECRLCAAELPHEPRPVLQVGPKARILLAGQAPGAKVHATGVPFDDPSGDRLRAWMGIDRETFFDDTKVAILPMGFCYPGKGKSGDLPPIPRCAKIWRRQLLGTMPAIRLTIVIGRYAQAWHLERSGETVSEVVREWARYKDSIIPLPHPSPRNNAWLKRNDWFESELIPVLQSRVKSALRD